MSTPNRYFRGRFQRLTRTRAAAGADWNQTTWVPLFDADGTTIGLVNAANVDAGPVTTYTYDPSGTPMASGTAND